MEGVSDFPLRLWQCLVAPPETMATPFLRATATYPARAIPEQFAPELFSLAGKLPYRLLPQVMAAEPEPFVRAARLLLDKSPVVELNCGCPSPTCTGKGAGSSLLREPEALAAFAAEVTAALGPGRVSVKMRTGYVDAGELPRLLDALAPHPLARLTVHGRTRPDRYKGKARWDLIELAARRMPCPVVASGDVVDAASCAALRQAAPAAAGVIVGRGALRHPFVFAELRGHSPQIEARLVPRLVAAFARITHLYATSFDTLLALVDGGLGQTPAGASVDAWDAVLERLGGDLEVTGQTVGRAKMLWGYMRSSLPPPYFEPKTMRARSLRELVDAIAALAPGGDERAMLTLRHRPELDWLYSGDKRGAAGAAPPGVALQA
jgi:tRNA-dihydrouridine synthase